VIRRDACYKYVEPSSLAHCFVSRCADWLSYLSSVLGTMASSDHVRMFSAVQVNAMLRQRLSRQGRDHDAETPSELQDVYLWTRIAVRKDATIREIRVRRRPLPDTAALQGLLK